MSQTWVSSFHRASSKGVVFPVIATQSLPAGTQGSTYSFTLTGVGVGPFIWAIPTQTGLNAWYINPATGVLSQFPTSNTVVYAETDQLMISLTDGYGNTAFAQLSLLVHPSSLAATPSFSPAAGTYSSAQSVTISDATPGATIYYTTDGSTPTTASAVYSSPVNVAATETLNAIATAPGFAQSSVGSAGYTIGSGGATLVFSYPNFNGSPASISLAGSFGAFSGGAVLIPANAAAHEAAGAWYNPSQPNIAAFTTNFTFTQQPSTFGFWFVCQNSTPASNGAYSGLNAVADANGEGFGDYTGQNAAIQFAVGINFGLTNINTTANMPAGFSSTGVYVNGGPTQAFFCPLSDMRSCGINLHAGHVMACKLVYDGTLLTMVLTDTATGAAARMSFPINIPAFVGANTAYVGFTGGGVAQPNGNSLLTWDYASGYNTRLATPTLSLASGTYASAQTVSISGPVGAPIYYTTNGIPPTATNATLYSGSITVSASEILQAVAIQTGFTDSFVASANYQIGAGLPRINFPIGTGFAASASQFINVAGCAAISAPNVAMTPLAGTDCIGAVWYATPLDITSFTSVFTYQGSTPANVLGACFVIQNQAASTSRAVPNSGGPYALSNTQNNSGLGYAGIMTSAAVALDQQTNSVGFWTGGAVGSETSLGSVNLASGHAMKVTVAYSGTTLTVTVLDTVTLGTATNTYTGVNMVSLVGANTAFVGFTFMNSAAGQAQPVQYIKDWTVT